MNVGVEPFLPRQTEQHNQTLHWTGATTVLVIRTLVVGPGQGMLVRYPLMRYFKFHWDESRGDEHDDWGTSWWYFEVADDGYVERQVEQYASGACLTYDRGYIEDKFGGLAEKPVEREDWKELQPFSAAEFETVWSNARPVNRKSG